MHVQLAGSARAIPSCRTDESGTLMMLPTDIALVRDPGFRPYVELYAKSQDAWFRDFAAAVRLLVSWHAAFVVTVYACTWIDATVFEAAVSGLPCRSAA